MEISWELAKKRGRNIAYQRLLKQINTKADLSPSRIMKDHLLPINAIELCNRVKICGKNNKYLKITEMSKMSLFFLNSREKVTHYKYIHKFLAWA